MKTKLFYTLFFTFCLLTAQTVYKTIENDATLESVENTQETKVHVLYCSDGSTEIINEHYLFDRCKRGVKPIMLIENYSSIIPVYKDTIPAILINTKKTRLKKENLMSNLTTTLDCGEEKKLHIHKLMTLFNKKITSKEYCELADEITLDIAIDSTLFADPPYLKKYETLVGKHDGIAKLKEKHNGVFGIDISRHQGNINWNKLVAADNPHPIFLVIMKATEGGNYVDKKFQLNWSEAKRVGIKRGAYHFFRPKTDPITQAQNFIRAVGVLEVGDIVPVIDVEKPCRRCSDLNGSHYNFMSNLKIMVDYIENHYGQKVLFYSGDNYYYNHVKGYFPDNYFWLARYSDYKIPRDFGRNTIGWQFTDAAKINGISSYVDLNFFIKDFIKEIELK